MTLPFRCCRGVLRVLRSHVCAFVSLPAVLCALVFASPFFLFLTCRVPSSFFSLLLSFPVFSLACRLFPFVLLAFLPLSSCIVFSSYRVLRLCLLFLCFLSFLFPDCFCLLCFSPLFLQVLLFSSWNCLLHAAPWLDTVEV